MKDRIIVALDLLLVGEILLARGEYEKIEKEYYRMLAQGGSADDAEVDELFNILEVFFLFQNNLDEGLESLKFSYRDYLLGKI